MIKSIGKKFIYIDTANKCKCLIKVVKSDRRCHDLLNPTIACYARLKNLCSSIQSVGGKCDGPDRVASDGISVPVCFILGKAKNIKL